jgi:hypothetical protein
MIRETREILPLPLAQASGKDKTGKRCNPGASAWRQTRQQAAAR